jgi:TRAP transporter TAXI family solute receptor
MAYRYRLLIVALLWFAVAIAAWRFVDTGGAERVVIAAGTRDGEAFLLAEAMAQVARAAWPNLEIEVLETAGSSENMRLVEAGRVDLATVQADTEVLPHVALVAPLYPDSFQLLVREDSTIRSVSDLTGHRIPVPPEGGGQFRSFWFLAAHYGLDPSSVTALPMSASAANFAMLEGAVDATFRVRAPGNASVLELIASAPVRLVPIHQGAALSLKDPAVGPGTIPAGSYRGHPPLPARDLDTVTVSRLLVARLGLDEELVRQLTSLLFEQRTTLVAITPLAGFVTTPGRLATTSMPVHPGAERYYDREKPTFWERNARATAPLLSILALLVSAVLALRARFQRAQKDRADRYNLELMRISEDARQSHEVNELFGLRDELHQILRKVLEDLEQDRVTREEFDFFSFTWQAADTVVRDELARRVHVPPEETRQ